MFSKRFFMWVGVGVLSVATIPTFAAPHLARLVARKPAARTTAAHKATPAKPVAKAVTTIKPATPVETKKAVTPPVAKAPAMSTKGSAAGSAAKKHVALAPKVAKALKTAAASKKNIH